MALFRFNVGNDSLEELANNHEKKQQQAVKNYKRVARRGQDCNGLPAVYLLTTNDAPDGTTTVNRTLLVRSQNHLYVLMLYSDLEHFNSDNMNSLFDTISASLKIQSRSDR
jgi:hypothetical protein